jgi:hypothetical protein
MLIIWFLIAPSANAMRRMLSLCDQFAEKCNIAFNASISKCLLFGGRNLRCIGSQFLPMAYCFCTAGKPMLLVSPRGPIWVKSLLKILTII